MSIDYTTDNYYAIDQPGDQLPDNSNIPNWDDEESLDNLVYQVAQQRAEIINNFIKTYIAVRADWFIENPERLRRINLVERTSQDGLTRTYTIEINRGKLPVKKK